MEREGSIESDVFDAGLFTYWGRLMFTAENNGGRVRLSAIAARFSRYAACALLPVSLKTATPNRQSNFFAK